MALNIITVDLTETISLDFLTVVCVWFLTEMTDSVSFSSLTAVLTEFRRLPDNLKFDDTSLCFVVGVERE